MLAGLKAEFESIAKGAANTNPSLSAAYSRKQTLGTSSIVWNIRAPNSQLLSLS
jgi:hypothetical protein